MYEIRHANGAATTRHETEDEARIEVERVYGGGCYILDEWQTRSPDAERLLVWPDEASSENDDGQRAVAEIVRENEDASVRLD